ncbi:MAG: tetratricopeptide repeat protein [Pasteurella oralis]|uniref:tetratricopeptide repeat protein n=1 Tax=Pasteurella oralis TaxID=1071947 RepID=UPI0027033B8F|nr:tetratricopeptide repeat protein [Pasteurella oralis]
MKFIKYIKLSIVLMGVTTSAFAKIEPQMLQAAKNNDIWAQVMLSLEYNQIGNHTKELFWLQKAISQNEKTPTLPIDALTPIYSRLGFLYINGKGVKHNAKRALAYSLRAAENQDPFAMHNLGIMYGNGVGTKVDLNKSFYWMTQACEHNYQPSCEILNSSK